MTTNLVLGAGPAAAATALALIAAGGAQEVVVLDIGSTLEPERQQLLASVEGLDPRAWPHDALAELAKHPEAARKGELPQKRLHGSDFPFRDRGQLQGVSAAQGANSAAVSGAFGGFSNSWGAQVMPFSRATLDGWPVTFDDLAPHYRTVLEHIPFAGADDDYSELFPLLAPARPLPPLGAQAQEVLLRYAQNRDRVRARGVTAGQARLAFDAPACISCGLCLTGCPNHLIYSASHTLERLRREGRITYVSGVLAHRVSEDDRQTTVVARELATGRDVTFHADRLFVACGGLGSTRLLLGSARPTTREAVLEEAVQFVLPFVSSRAGVDPRQERTFTLNQFNLLVEYGEAGRDLAQLHLYPYNPGYDDQVPWPLAKSERLKAAVLRRVAAALGYLPSWDSPRVGLDVGPIGSGLLPAVGLRSINNPRTRPVLRSVMRRLVSVAPALDLWPAVPALTISGPAKSYHFGGSFPHVAGSPGEGRLETDRLGRLAEWRNIHVVDGAVLPSVAATTFTLTVMANAHRIASEAMAGA